MHKMHSGLGMHSQVQSAIGSGAINHQRLSGFQGFMAASNAWWSVEALDFKCHNII